MPLLFLNIPGRQDIGRRSLTLKAATSSLGLSRQTKLRKSLWDHSWNVWVVAIILKGNLFKVRLTLVFQCSSGVKLRKNPSPYVLLTAFPPDTANPFSESPHLFSFHQPIDSEVILRQFLVRRYSMDKRMTSPTQP